MKAGIPPLDKGLRSTKMWNGIALHPVVKAIVAEWHLTSGHLTGMLRSNVRNALTPLPWRLQAAVVKTTCKTQKKQLGSWTLNEWLYP